MKPNPKLQLAVKRNNRKQHLSEFSRVLGVSTGWDYSALTKLDLKEALALSAKIPRVIKDYRYRNILDSSCGLEGSAFLTKIDQYLQIAIDTNCWVILCNYEYMGAFSVDLSEFLKKGRSLLEMDKDTVWAVNESVSNGIMLDFYIDPLEGGGGYEISTWGDKWFGRKIN